MDKLSATIRCEYPSIVIEQLLNAIRLSSPEARQRFPRLLQIVSLYNSGGELIEKFIEHSRSIPCWMFLGWLSQITAVLLDRPVEAHAIEHIVERICDEYPKAFVYAFKMSLERIEAEPNASLNKNLIARLKARLRGSFMQIENQFVAALEQLASNPHIMFKVFR